MTSETATTKDGGVSIEIRDSSPAATPGVWTRWAVRFVRDPRDAVFVTLTASALVVMLTMAILAFVPGVLSPWYALAYLAVLFAGFVDRYILMLHCTSHRRLFGRGLGALNHVIPAVLGPLMGQTPYTYFAHHVGMHHPENNLADDLSCTLKYRRDSFAHFMRYFGSFFFFGIFELTRYHLQRKQMKLARMAVLGELTWYLLVVGLAFVNLAATLVVLVIPLVLVRFLMMAGNWSQHAFIDARDVANPYKNSITCINTRYNRRCFNDGYHIGHHVKANRHWADMPSDFAANLDRYRDEDAVVFEGVDYFQIWAMLMLKRYDALAKRFVELRGDARTPTEVAALLRERTRPIVAAG
ncbi:MAG: fatty acid desaturase [Deltaproteobacteria bacterium HGW-Deltaproteobacteria-14]|nr:MAG: fatty acid desaturase [Deltaproteobacteria bacterium HGW-Deltaproteobacteria-14]